MGCVTLLSYSDVTSFGLTVDENLQKNGYANVLQKLRAHPADQGAT